MCFSAEASFTAAAILLGVGILNVRKNSDRSMFLFALMPLLFAVQQFSEGLLWVSLEFPGYHMLRTVSKYFFLTFAIVIWPSFVSMSLLKIEDGRMRRNILKVFLAVSLFWSFSSIIYMFIYHPSASIASGHISYSVFFPGNLPFSLSFVYGVLTVIPFFISNDSIFWIFGSLVTVTGTFTYIYWQSFFTSIWCFFAAIVSIHSHAIIRSNEFGEMNIPFLSDRNLLWWSKDKK